MPKFRGTVKKNALEGGFWELVCEDGTSYQLAGGDEGLRQHGSHVEIDGKIDKGAFGLGMTGPVLVVKSYTTG